MSQVVRRMKPVHLALGAALAAALMTIGILADSSAQASAPSLATAARSAKAPATQLDHARTVDINGTRLVRFDQEVGGVPVLGATVAVIDGAGVAPSVMTDSSVGGIDQPPAPDVSATQAIAAARAATGAKGNRATPTADLGIDPGHGNALVRQVLIASKRPLQDFEVTVDAQSGKVLATRKRLQYDTGSASLYTPNPVVTNGGYSGIGEGRVADHHDKDTARLTSLRTPVTLLNLDTGDCLSGDFVKSKLGTKNGEKVCKTGRDWTNVTRSKDTFEALMAYYHLDTITNYLHDQGFTGLNDVHPTRITSLADNFSDDNSFYSPGDQMLHFGTGAVDDAEDGDVITHEFGHAIQDSQSPGFGSTDQSGALGEGFGDFMSALNTFITPSVPDYTTAEYCIFDWDGTGGYGGPGVKPCGRLATGMETGGDSTNTYDDAKHTCSLGGGQYEIHCLGEVWSHGLIDLLNDLPADGGGNPPIVQDLFTSQFAYRDDETFKEAVDDLVLADQALYPSGSSGLHVTAICAEMKGARGIDALSCP